MRWISGSFVVLCGCGSASVALPDLGGEVGADGPGEGSGAGEEGGTPGPDDTGDSGDELASVSDLRAAVHEAMPSIIVLTWTQEGSGQITAEYSFDEGPWLRTPTWEVEAGARRLLLLGIPFGADVTWRLLVDGEPAAADAVIEAGGPPDGMPEVGDVEGDPADWDPATPWVLTSLTASQGAGGSDHAWTLIVDRQGRVVWANETPATRTTFQPQLSVDRTEILVDYNSWWGDFDGGVSSQVARLDIEGAELGRYDTPGMIHPFTQTGSGAIVWGAAGFGGGDETLDILEPGEPPRTLFDCTGFVSDYDNEGCGSNALWWNPEDGHLLFSLYSLDTVIEVDEAGEPVRWFGHMDGSWSFSPRDSTFWWQHGAHLLPDGDLLVSTRVDEDTDETVVREYRLDEAEETLVEVWSFGEGEGVWAYIMGEPRRLPGGNTWHNYGWDARIREATPDGDVVWEVEWDDAGTIGRMEPLDLEDLYALWGSEP